MGSFAEPLAEPARSSTCIAQLALVANSYTWGAFVYIIGPFTFRNEVYYRRQPNGAKMASGGSYVYINEI